MVTKNPLFKMFGESPVRPLQQHMDKVQACVNELHPYFEAVLSANWDEAKDLQKKISSLEGEADKLKKALRMHLPKSIFLPVSRRDLLELLSMQDRVANRAKDIAGLILGRKMEFPEKLNKNFLGYVDLCIDTSAQAQVAINELDELMETGFQGKEVKLVESMIKTLNKLEGDTDKMQVKIRASLFKIEKDLPPVDVMFLYQIIEWVGDLADLSQRVGSRLELLLAK
jgi:predicted phosphate transport protein (TIGR00153 family)